MPKTAIKVSRRRRRKSGIRRRLVGTPQRPRLTVFRSLRHMHAQIIDDIGARTLVAASSLKLSAGGNRNAAVEVGKALAQKARDAGIQEVAFDRNGFKYHGRVRALADAAREAGLTF